MSKNRMVNSKFWSDNFVVDKLNPLDRYLFLYLLTNEHTNMIGIYELPLRTAAFETGIEKDNLLSMMQALSPKVEFFNGWVYIRRFTDHQSVNPNIEKGMMKAIFALPADVIKHILSLGIDSPKLAKYFESLTKAFESQPKQFAIPEPEKELKPEPELKPKKDTIVSSKSATKKVASKEIDETFSYWADKVGYGITSQVKSNREYCAKLIREYKPDDIQRMIDGVAMSHSDQYAPRISNFIQLYKKWDDLKAWGRRSMNKSQQGRGIKL